jgi:glycosyltransferase involved in cell wall biosynthesis
MKLSVITTVLNGMPFLADAIASCPARSDVEHIVIDAGSTDDSWEEIGKHRHLRVFREPGISLYAAWNKGIDLAVGDAVLFLNADDILLPDPTLCLFKELMSQKDVMIIEGQAGHFSRTAPDGSPADLCLYPLPGGVDQTENLIFGAPTINAKIFRKSVFLDTKPFNETFELAADRYFLLQGFLKKIKSVPGSVPIYYYRRHLKSATLSGDAKNRLKISNEHRRISDLLISQVETERERLMLEAWKVHETVAAGITLIRNGSLVKGGRTVFSALAYFGGLGGFIRAWRIRKRIHRPINQS